jgi:hypothetical protein
VVAVFNVPVTRRRTLYGAVSLFLLISSAACAAHNQGATPAAPVTVTVTPSVTPPPDSTTPTTHPAKPKPSVSKVDRLVNRARERNRHLRNGTSSFILQRPDVAGAVKATVHSCHMPDPSSYYQTDNGCFIAVDVTIVSGENGLIVNPVDFYILDKANRRFNEGDGDSGIVPITGSRLGFSDLNNKEVLSGLLSFDAPAHGRLVYDPPFADSRVVWIF